MIALGAMEQERMAFLSEPLHAVQETRARESPMRR